ncbi:MAG: stage II sporulation protein M [Deltaproteobacteria bacterium]|nr:stage II sporulation protein M [Deltaproteobacteria bacterium]
MNLSRFVDERRGSWRRLEHLLRSLERSGPKSLDPQEVRDLARLYRSASADLLLARSLPGSDDVVAYLEAVVGRAYVSIHPPRAVRWSGALRWATHSFPAVARRNRRFLFASAGIFALGFLLAFVLVLADQAAFDHLVPSSIASFYGERPDDYRGARFGVLGGSEAARFGSELMVNNIRVTLQAFALGLTLGVGTAAVLFNNGVVLGALAANFARWELSVPFWALILPHGIAEMFAMVLGGAGGLMLAEAVIRPGARTRSQALRVRGLEALTLSAMALPLLVFAGVVEAYVTPLEAVPDPMKLVFALGTAVTLGLWLRAPWLESGPP